MALEVSAGLTPTGGGSWETHDAQFGKGGFRAVLDNTARDAITTPRRSEGMQVYIIATGNTYRLGAGLTNADWILQSAGSITAGNGLTGTTTFAVLANGASLEVAAAGVRRGPLTGAVTAAAGATATAFGSGDFGSLDITTLGDVFFGVAATVPAIFQLPDSTASVVGQTFTIAAQAVTGAGATGAAIVVVAGSSSGPSGTRVGGSATFGSGAGSTRAGNLFINVGATSTFQSYSATDPGTPGETIIDTTLNALRLRTAGGLRMSIASNAITFITALAIFNDTTASPKFGQQDQVANSATGQPLTVGAQNCTGTTSTGGNLLCKGGTGTSTNGGVRIQTAGGTTRLEVNDAGLAFFGASPAAKPTVTGAKAGNAALTSLLTALATLGLLTDSST